MRSKFFAAIGVACVLGVVLPPRAMAEVSEEEFKKLVEQVGQLDQKVQSLQQVHEQDQQTIKELQQPKEIVSNVGQETDVSSSQQLRQPFVNLAVEATHNVVLSGDAEVQFGRAGGQHSGFGLADFAPIFLYRANDNILLEAGFDVTLQNGSTTLLNGKTGNIGTQTSVDLSFATLDYMFNDYVTFVGGETLLPLGTYTIRSAGWLNKMPDDPLPRSVLPNNGVGVQLRGAVPICNSGGMFTYTVFAVNGPGSVDGTGNSTFTDSSGNVLPNLDFSNVGFNSDGSAGNLNTTPSAGGRFAFFVPFRPHYDVEFGLSGQSGEWESTGQEMWSAGVIDGSVHISSYFEVKGEYISTSVQTADIGNYYPRGWWVQAAYKLAGLPGNLPLIRNLELVSRYDIVNDGLGTKTDRTSTGFVYYFTNTLQFKGVYEWLHSRGPNALPNNAFTLELSFGF